MKMPREFELAGAAHSGPRGSVWLRLRWWLIRRLAGSNITVVLNATGNQHGFIIIGTRPSFFIDGCKDVRLVATPEVMRAIYDDNPFGVTRERP